MLANRPPQSAEGQVLPPSHFNGDVPPAMDAVVVKALAPDPGDRYPDVRSFMKAFGAVSLAPVVKKALTVTDKGRCPNCGAGNQTSRFCRKCGSPLQQADEDGASHMTSDDVLAQPIQITKIDVGSVEVGAGDTVAGHRHRQAHVGSDRRCARPVPRALEVPTIVPEDLWAFVLDLAPVVMPEPPPMPTIDWAEIAPPMPEVPTFDDSLVDPEDD